MMNASATCNLPVASLLQLCAAALLCLLSPGCDEQVGTGPEDDAGADNLLLVPVGSIYEQLPDITLCDPGRLDPAHTNTVLLYINSRRTAHGLSPVSFAHDFDSATTGASMIIAANGRLEREPGPNVDCWSPQGLLGAQNSSLTIVTVRGSTDRAYNTRSLIDVWWKDAQSADLAQRRWLLDPFLTFISFGRVDRVSEEDTTVTTGAALWPEHEIYAEPGRISVDYVAYPDGLIPSNLFNSTLSMSFSAIVDRRDYWSNLNVDLSEATITVVDEDGNVGQVSNVRRFNDPSGLPNCLAWNVPVESGVRYSVTVQGVRYLGEPLEYSYWFEIDEEG